MWETGHLLWGGIVMSGGRDGMGLGVGAQVAPQRRSHLHTQKMKRHFSRIIYTSLFGYHVFSRCLKDQYQA